ncbi:MAG: hypothetical protein LUC22_00320 [Prevotella sp.]|nr:hypothetical protein [Prevotella sp.]
MQQEYTDRQIRKSGFGETETDGGQRRYTPRRSALLKRCREVQDELKGKTIIENTSFAGETSFAIERLFPNETGTSVHFATKEPIIHGGREIVVPVENMAELLKSGRVKLHYETLNGTGVRVVTLFETWRANLIASRTAKSVKSDNDNDNDNDISLTI